MTLTQKQKTRLTKLFKENNYESLFVNKKGEVFTSENLAQLSVKSKKDYMKVTRSEAASWGATKRTETTGGEAGGGTSKANK